MSPVCLLLLACTCRPPAPPEVPAAPPPAAPALPAGELADGLYLDHRWGFSIAVPEGMTAWIGRDDGSIRLTLTSERTRARLAIWVFADAMDTFRPRSDCRWDFVDTARYRALGGTRPLTVGTCTPLQVEAPLVQGWLLPGPAATVQAEVDLPAGVVQEGREEAEAVLRSLRWETPSPLSGG